MDYTCHVISHTHWDREWYLPYELFRLRLVDLVDRLLDLMESDPDYRYFNLDGQAIILEDYLKIRPENEDRLRSLIREGRITIGPWYVLNDEFLVSGESTIRSLLIGHKVVSKFGPVMKVGYLPDQFGNISQMPQILRNFGIDSGIFGRGYQIVGDRKMEFYWESPDGSRVLSSLMAFWYNNAQNIPSDPLMAEQAIADITRRMASASRSSQLLLMNGVDHLEAQYDLSTALKHLRANPPSFHVKANIGDSNREAIEGYSASMRGDSSDGESQGQHGEMLASSKVIHSTLPGYIDAIKRDLSDKSVDTVVGELREDRRGSILAGVLSSRVYLKQANERCMRELEKYAEPASVWAMCAGKKAQPFRGGFTYPAGELEYAWKLLMENHPHDSICGCSTDEVHAEMEPRFTRVEQLGTELTDRALSYIADRVKANGLALVVFNSLTWERTDVVRATIDVPLGEPDRAAPQQDGSRDWPGLEIVAMDGQKVPYTLVSNRKMARSVIHPETLPMVQWIRRFEVEFIAHDVPAMGYTTFNLHKADQMPDFGSILTDGCHSEFGISNEELDISLNAINGGSGLDLYFGDGNDASMYFFRISAFEDGGDVGDEYTYRKPNRDVRITGAGALRQARVLAEGAASGMLELRYDMGIPEAATPDKETRSDRDVSCPITLRAKIYQGINRVEFDATIENHAKDHRLRAIFPSEAEGATHSVAGAAFDVIERPLKIPADWPSASTFHPMDGWVDVSNEEQGLAVFVDGLREYELYDDSSRSLAITLLRSVGILSGSGDIPHVQHTPGAQCIGENHARYAVFPHKGDWKTAKVWKEALNYQTPLRPVLVGDLDRSRTIETVEETLPETLSFVSISVDELVPSALKKEETGDGIVLRCWNALQETVAGEIYVRCAKKAWKSNMAEERMEEISIAGGKVHIEVGAREIVTFIFEA